MNQNTLKDKKILGAALRNLRESRADFLERVAEKVGISAAYLSLVERGLKRPSKLVLVKLINYYELKESQANFYYMHAGYRDLMKDANQTEQDFPGLQFKVENGDGKGGVNMSQENVEQSPVQIDLDPTKAPILYTDSIFINSNENGVVLSVAQSMGPLPKQTVVARVGMSREHAKALYKALGDNLKITEFAKDKKN